MNNSISPRGSTVPGRRILHFALACLVCAGLVWGVTQWLWRPRVQNAPPGRDTKEPHYRNTELGVAYVGDESCRSCHQRIYERYRRHPMGQSLGPAAEVAALESFDASGHPTFTAAGLHYEVFRKGQALVHRESNRDSQGKAIDSREAEIRYAIGSGSRGRSYILDLDGRLFLSPIAWYSLPKRWDLSPQYDKAHLHFERALKVDCLFCHSNGVEPVANTVNQYEQPLVRGYAIGCERCHGPGAIHVHEQETGEGDATAPIVNPGKLSPVLRDAVCEQCHLLGEVRIARQGRQ